MLDIDSKSRSRSRSRRRPISPSSQLRQLFGGSYLFWARRWLQLKAFNNITYGESRGAAVRKGASGPSLITSQSCGGLNEWVSWFFCFNFFCIFCFLGRLSGVKHRAQSGFNENAFVSEVFWFPPHLWRIVEPPIGSPTESCTCYSHPRSPRDQSGLSLVQKEKQKKLQELTMSRQGVNSLSAQGLFRCSLLSPPAKVNNNNSNRINDSTSSHKSKNAFGQRFASIIKISFMSYGWFAIFVQIATSIFFVFGPPVARATYAIKIFVYVSIKIQLSKHNNKAWNYVIAAEISRTFCQ